MKRIVLGALAGGAVLFVWGALAWTVLPLHTPTIKDIPNEDELRAVVRKNVTQPGFYTLPGWGHTEGASKEQQKAAEEAAMQKYREGPRGVMVLLPTGGDPMMAMTFVKGFALNVVASFVAAWLLSKAAGSLKSYGARVQFVTVTGLFAGIAVHMMYWNWMDFPTNYTVACLADITIGWLLVGLVLAAIVKPQPS